MNIGYRITRAAIETAIDKGIKDVKYDTDRAIRNLIDLGEYFSTGEYQREFFDLAHSILEGGENPYSCIFKNAVERVDNNIIKTFGINLGYGSFTYGPELLRRHEDESEHMMPWAISVDMRGCAGPTCLDRLVDEGMKLGIYLYSIAADRRSCDDIIDAALNHRECAFIVFVQSSEIDDSLAEGACDAANIIIFAGIEPNGCASDSAAFNILSKHRCLYGYVVIYNATNCEYLLSDSFLSDREDDGCFLGCYVADARCDDEIAKQVHDEIVASRIKSSHAMFLVDFTKDWEYIGKRAAGNDLLLRLNLYDNTAASCNQAGIYRQTVIGNDSLSDIMIRVMPANDINSQD